MWTILLLLPGCPKSLCPVRWRVATFAHVRTLLMIHFSLVGQFRYESRITGEPDFLPIAASIVGPPGEFT